MTQSKHGKNNFSFGVATVNGSGSQSANFILAKTLFRMGLTVGAKNIFPSNISGLATWYFLRVSDNAYIGRKRKQDFFVAKNSESVKEDVHHLTEGGLFFYDSEFKLGDYKWPDHVRPIPIPYRELTHDLSDSIKMRKYLTNMIYVGILSHQLGLDESILRQVVKDQFSSKESVVALNISAISKGADYAKNNLTNLDFPWKAVPDIKTKDQIYIDGNTAAAMGAVCGGCTVFSWYPITPATSLADAFQEYCREWRSSENEKNNYAILQAEDELAAIGMVLGAGWAGARAMTSTSGPGLSLMAESAGLSYFAEIPAVLWDIQRAGPSTGLPTRTMQGDIRAAHHLSHGDVEHLVLLPSTPEECFQYAQLAFDLSEELQTLVIVLSDLDLGMNFHVSNNLQLPKNPFRRGKVLDANDLNQVEEFSRYKDVDGDGVPYRTRPGTLHPLAAYFTRGTGHNEKSAYTEDSENYSKLLTRLKEKIFKAKDKLPGAQIQKIANPNQKAAKNIGLAYYGSTKLIMNEVTDLLLQNNLNIHLIEIKSLPLASEIEAAFKDLNSIFIIEQNRDGQMADLVIQKYPQFAGKTFRVLSFDGWPLSPELVVDRIRDYV